MKITFTKDLNYACSETMRRLGFVRQAHRNGQLWVFREDLNPHEADLNEVYHVAVSYGGRFTVDPR